MAKYPVVGIKTLFAMPEPPMLVEGILPRQGITGISAEPNIGKTFLTMELARAVATGGMFLNKFQARPGAVLFVGQDSSILDYARQLRKTIMMEREQQLQHTPVTDFDDRMFFICPSDATARRVWVDNREDTKDLIETANSIVHSDSGEPYVEHIFNESTGEFDAVEYESGVRGVSLIIVDTLSASHSSNENSNTEMNEVFRNVRMLAEQTRAAVVITHHHTKTNEYSGSNNHWRGASAQHASLDNHIELSGKAGNPIVKVSIKKFRGIRYPDFEYQMDVNEDRAVLTYLSDADKPTEAEELRAAVLTYLRDVDEPVSNAEIAKSILPATILENDAEAMKKFYHKVSNALSILKKRRVVFTPSFGKWKVVTKHGDLTNRPAADVDNDSTE